jgi:hypothetical protein
MAKYDMDFDIRDKARMLRGILFECNSDTIKSAKMSLFLSQREW